MIPTNITKAHLEQAIAEIETQGIRKGRHSSTYDLIYQGKTYPPKLVISIANRYANGEELDPGIFAGVKGKEAFVLLEEAGFEIRAKQDPLRQLVENYKARIAEIGLTKEVYKWEMVEQYRGRPDTSAADFLAELKSIDFKNLIYHMARGVLYHIASDKPEELRQAFIALYDEKQGLTERIKAFRKDTLALYRAIGQTEGHHQDERSAAAYLTLQYPEKYTFYKASFYNKFCQLLDVKKAKTTEKYTHYLELLENFIEDYIVTDQELISQVKNLIPEYYDGSNHLLLAQDILFQMLDQKKEPSYWVFQGNPKMFDISTALREELLTDWTVSAHKDKIKAGDKVILWMTGDQAGCYALAEVSSEPHPKTAAPDEHLWKVEDQAELKAGLKITHNLGDRPITKAETELHQDLQNLNAGNQGTNFKATAKEYAALLALAEETPDSRRYWLYAPGENASRWEEFHEQGIMALDWDELGDLQELGDKKDITAAIKSQYQTETNPTNNAKACFQFRDVISVGDIIIPKKGRQEYLGYGIVTSDYFFDDTRDQYWHCRKVDWKKKGVWVESQENIVLKTLTDITPYPDYVRNLIDLIGIEKESSQNTPLEPMNFPLNTILYGPPGTGKTYNTIKRAAEIVANHSIDNYEEALRIFREKKEGGQIEFITFHQNYSYEDFIQGLRPDVKDENEQLKFKKSDGVFKVIADRAYSNIVDSEKAPEEMSQVKAFGEALEILKDKILESDDPIKINDTAYFTAVEDDAFRYSGDNWTLNEKGFNGFRMKYSDLERFFEEGVKERKEIKNLDNISGLAKQHATYFIKTFELVKSLIPNSSIKAQKTDKKNYVIIIDEINRANISRVFGELITLIEPDKRSHGKIPMEVRLPSGDKFMVPSNLYLIGTMNTADKSIALLDIALRRRFEFEAMYPNYELPGIYDVEILQKINAQIIKTKGYDFQIGHAYFMGENNDLVTRMNKKVIPLLLEYYMNDEQEVKKILKTAGLRLKEGVWPLQIEGKDD